MSEEHVNIASTNGAILIGSLVALLLSGCLALQCIVYSKLYPSDLRSNKILVWTIWFLDLLHSVFVSMSCWHYLVEGFADPSTIFVVHWTIAMTIPVTAILTLIVHCFFARRIFKLSGRNMFLTIPILVFAVLRLTSACATTGAMIKLRTFDEFKAQYTWLFTLGLALSTVVDILISSSLTYLLRESRQSGPSSLNEVFDTLIIYTWENGSITCIGTILSMICWITMPYNLIFMGMHFAIAKLYANSFMAILNSRHQLRMNRPDVVSDHAFSGSVSDNDKQYHNMHVLSGISIERSIKVVVEESDEYRSPNIRRNFSQSRSQVLTSPR